MVFNKFRISLVLTAFWVVICSVRWGGHMWRLGDDLILPLIIGIPAIWLVIYAIGWATSPSPAATVPSRIKQGLSDFSSTPIRELPRGKRWLAYSLLILLALVVMTLTRLLLR